MTRGRQRHAGRPVQRIHQRLGSQRTDAAPRVYAQRADRKEAAGDRHTEIPAAIAGEDGPGQGKYRLVGCIMASDTRGPDARPGLEGIDGRAQ